MPTNVKKLAQAEKDFLKNKIGVKRFLRILGHSDVYFRRVLPQLLEPQIY